MILNRKTRRRAGFYVDCSDDQKLFHRNVEKDEDDEDNEDEDGVDEDDDNWTNPSRHGYCDKQVHLPQRHFLRERQHMLSSSRDCAENVGSDLESKDERSQTNIKLLCSPRFGVRRRWCDRSPSNRRAFLLSQFRTLLILLISVVLVSNTSLFLPVAEASDTSTEDDDSANVNKDDSSSSCTLYLAPSTIPGAGLGIFSAIARRKGEAIHLWQANDPLLQAKHHSSDDDNGDDNVGTDGCIPVVDLYWHTGRISGTAKPTKKLPKLFNPFKDYFWDGHTMGMHSESMRHDIEAFCPGLDAMINCHLALVNVEKAIPDYYEHDNTLRHDAHFRGSLDNLGEHDNTQRHGHGSLDNPGAGAYSPYWNSSTLVTKTTRAIPAGGEIFKYYGDSFFTSRDRVFGADMALFDDYPAANVVLRRFVRLMKRLDLISTASTNKSVSNVAQDLYEDVIWSMQRRFVSRRLNALPKTLTQAIQAALFVSNENETNGIAHVVHQPLHIRPPEILHASGVCLDRIAVRRESLLPHAGFGAFATRPMRKGTVITTSPVHHVPSYTTWFHMYNFTTMPNMKQNGSSKNGRNSGGANVHWIRLLDEMDQLQLLYNYCYGVSDSSLLLCPYGNGVNYINHNRSLANVRIAWPSIELAWMHNHSAVSHGTLADLSRSTKQQLALSYVATRDINVGDELYLDYGADWEAAWLDHVATYQTRRQQLLRRKHETWKGGDHSTGQARQGDGSYVSAHRWNAEFDDAPVRSETQQQLDPYPSNLQVRCHRRLLRMMAQTASPTANGTAPQHHYVWGPNDYGLPCRVLDRFPESMNAVPQANHSQTRAETLADLYTVQLEWRQEDGDSYDGDEDDDLDEEDIDWDEVLADLGVSDDVESKNPNSAVLWIERTDVPRSAIRFFDVPYSTDIHQSIAFRHEIGIPNDMFPPQWRNL